MISTSVRPRSRSRCRSASRDRRRVDDDPLGEVHDGEVDRVERPFAVVDDGDDVLAQLVA